MVEPWYDHPTPQQQFIFEASSLPTKNVIVYCDRAEVKRIVIANLNKGTNEIIIQNVSAVIERQSVRVDGRGALIQEVQYQEMPIDTETENEKVQNLEDQKLKLENMRFAVEDEIGSLKKRIDVLDGVAAQIASGPASAATSTTQANDPSPYGSQPNLSRRHTITVPSTLGGGGLLGNSPIGFLMNEDALDNLEKFLNYYGTTTADMKAELRKKQRQIDQLRCGFEYDSIKRNISIIVEMDFAGPVELYLSYQVYCASWKPTYDIRASTTSEGEQSVKLCYYGLVEQNTGDDWKDTELVLSTASPSVGGSAPALATLTASLHRSSRYRTRHASAARRKPMSAASEEDMGFGSFDFNEIVDAAAMHRYNNGQMSRSSEDSTSTPSIENVMSTCFSIPRTVSIPYNGHEQKVLVAMVDLASAFFHETVPSRCCSAFLSASITNTSTYPILPGPASIYLNNSFVSKTHLRAVAPGEEFRCALGMDPSIKVEYKPPISYHEQVGLISKSTVVTHEQCITLRNAKVAQAVQITMKEQIPKSADEKIKISIVSPDIRTKGTEARLNRDHNLEWSMVLAAGQQKDLVVKYTVEHPASESVSFRLVGM